MEETLLAPLGIIIGLISFFTSYYFGTQRTRRRNNFENIKAKKNKLEKYMSDEGPAAIQLSVFITLLYILMLAFFSASLYLFTINFTSNLDVVRLVRHMVAGTAGAIGIILFQELRALSYMHNPKEAMLKFDKKLSKIAEADKPLDH
jgi:hypothetical protein